MTNPENENNKPILKNDTSATDSKISQTLKGSVSLSAPKEKVALYVPSGHSFDSLSLEGVSELVVYDPSNFSLKKDLNHLKQLGITEIRIIPPKKTYNEIGDMGDASGVIAQIWKATSTNRIAVRTLNSLENTPVVSIVFETAQDTLTGWNGGKGGVSGALYGLGKGVFSGVISSAAGIVTGAASGAAGCIASLGNPLVTTASTIIGSIEGSKIADNWADDKYDKFIKQVDEVKDGLQEIDKLNEALQSKTITKGNWNGSDIGGSIISTPKGFYDPITGQETFYNPAQRISPGKNGIFDTDDGLTSSNKAALPGAAAQPFGRKELYRTPNAKTIDKVLYSGKQLGANYMKGYLVDRSMELMLGKKLSRTVGKYAGHYANVSMVAKTVAPNAWQAATSAVWGSIARSAIGKAVSSAWGAIAKTAIGQAVKGAISGLLGSALGTAIGAALPWVGVAMMGYSLFKMFF